MTDEEEPFPPRLPYQQAEFPARKVRFLSAEWWARHEAWSKMIDIKYQINRGEKTDV